MLFMHEPSLISRKEKSFASRRVRTHPFIITSDIGDWAPSASLTLVLLIFSSSNLPAQKQNSSHPASVFPVQVSPALDILPPFFKD
jgi:hypothetical protein